MKCGIKIVLTAFFLMFIFCGKKDTPKDRENVPAAVSDSASLQSPVLEPQPDEPEPELDSVALRHKNAKKSLKTALDDYMKSILADPNSKEARRALKTAMDDYMKSMLIDPNSKDARNALKNVIDDYMKDYQVDPDIEKAFSDVVDDYMKDMQAHKFKDPEMILVRGGAFTMGCTEEQGNECYEDEGPTRRITLRNFYIGKYEVTQELWVKVMGNNPSHFKGNKLPVEQVSWNDIQEFIKKLNTITGRKYRLPTEAEWEYAARGGSNSKNFKYSGSNNIDEVAWYGNNSGSKTRAIGTKRPNELGIYDMSGNVWEWVSDWYDFYTDTSMTNPTGPSSGSNRVYRGGSWFSGARSCRVSYRFAASSIRVFATTIWASALPCPPEFAGFWAEPQRQLLVLCFSAERDERSLF
ncbi:MAG: formylglycine-generating enzyme family protein [Chitinispirillales bacterium]|jgi:formylglycine-generating enzyme required for sulfatase activity|nr:formylglycine-generating enzyme family protein [Chitinispirillales bacterium]